MSSNCISCNTLVITNEFMEKVKEKQCEDSKLKNFTGLLNTDKTMRTSKPKGIIVSRNLTKSSQT